METSTVELHSSASSNLHPENSIPSFTNFLPNQINLYGKWEVALTDMFPLKVFLPSRKVDLELVCPQEGKLLNQKNTNFSLATTQQ